MKLYALPALNRDTFLSHLRTLAKTATVEAHWESEKESTFYLNISDKCFDLYERPAFSKGKSSALGGMYLRGAIVQGSDHGCIVAMQITKFPENIRGILLALFFLAVSVVMTVLSGNLFATMFPLLGLICLGYLIADLVASLLQFGRLKSHWNLILHSAPCGEEASP